MRHLARFTFLVALMLALPALKMYAQHSFEGTITWSMTMPAMGDEDKHSMITNVKEGKSENEIDLGAMGMVKTYLDPASKKVYSVMEATHSGYQGDIPSDSGVTIALKPTGKKDKIAGHQAEEYTFTDGPAECSVWGGSGFSQSLCDNGKHIGQDNIMKSAMNQLAKKGLFPVKLVVSANGEVATTVEFVKYEEKKIDDSIFIVPTDVKFQPMPHMGGGGTN